MRRNKIKQKYLDKIYFDNNYKNNDFNMDNKLDIDSNMADKDMYSSILNRTFSFFKSFGLILLMLLWSYIPLSFLLLFGINYHSFNEFAKLIYVILCDISFFIFIMYIYRKDFCGGLKRFINNPKYYLGQCFKYWGIGLVIMISSNLIINLINGGVVPGNEESVRELIDKMPLYMLFHLVIYAPITEELIFRRSLSDAFSNKYFYAIFSGLIFGGMHVVLDVGSWMEILYIIPYSSLGIAFAFLYRDTNNIFSTIFIHAFHNFLTLLLYLGTI